MPDRERRVKTFVKSLPFALRLRRAARDLVRSLTAAIVGAVYWAPHRTSRRIRRACFDSAPPHTILVSSAGTECFLVSSSDNLIGRETYVGGAFDFEKFERVLSLLDPSFRRSLLVDIGANIGTICIPAVKRELFERAVAFEPEPFNYSLLVSNVAINGLSEEIVTHNLALGAEPGSELLFELSEDSFGDHRARIVDTSGLHEESLRRTTTVRCESFDHVVGKVDPRSTLIWMDTQGFEGFVLQGAQGALAARPPLVIEFWPYGMDRSGSYDSLKRSLLQAGYSAFYDLGEDGSAVPVSEETLDLVFERFRHDDRFTDLLVL